MLFVVWLSEKVIGTTNAKQFAAAIGKGETQLSKWISEDPRPGWDSIKTIAAAVKISPSWLDSPDQDPDKEPPDFAAWIAARRAKEASSALEKQGRIDEATTAGEVRVGRAKKPKVAATGRGGRGK